MSVTATDEQVLLSGVWGWPLPSALFRPYLHKTIQPMQNFSLFPLQYQKLCMKMRVMKTSMFRLQSQNQARKRCDSLLHNTKANTKESESLPTRLQMWLKSKNQNKAAFITDANSLWWHSGGVDTRSRSEAIRSETITQNKHAAVRLWCHKHLWGRENTKFVHVSLWWIELIAIDLPRRPPEVTARGVHRNFSLSWRWNSVPADTSCPCRAQWLSAACERCRTLQVTGGWVAPARQLLIGTLRSMAWVRSSEQPAGRP